MYEVSQGYLTVQQYNLRIHFTAIGVSETWLNDHICDLYHIEGYDIIEVHRHSKRGGGVGIFLDNNIPHQIHTDIFLKDDVSENIFIEIDKDVIQIYLISTHLYLYCSVSWYRKTNSATSWGTITQIS